MLLDLLTPSNLISVILMLAVTAGGLYGFRRAYVKSLGEMQAKVIEIYKEQNDAQEKKIKAQDREIADCKKEIAHLKRVFVTIQYALKRRGISIEIDGDAITLIDSTNKSHTVQIQVSEGEPTVQNSEEQVE